MTMTTAPRGPEEGATPRGQCKRTPSPVLAPCSPRPRIVSLRAEARLPWIAYDHARTVRARRASLETSLEGRHGHEKAVRARSAGAGGAARLVRLGAGI